MRKRKPKGFGKFDALMRKLVKVPPLPSKVPPHLRELHDELQDVLAKRRKAKPKKSK